MWRFFCPSGFAVRWVILQPLPGILIIPSCKQLAIPQSLYKILILFEYLTFAVDVNYDAASLSAISHMGIGSGKGVFTAVKQPIYPGLCPPTYHRW